jgi:hypothetical protein
MKGQEAFHPKGNLIGGPSHCPENYPPLQLPLMLEQESASFNIAAARQSQDEKTHEEKLKHHVTTKKKKTFRKSATHSQRQGNRSVRIVSRQVSAQDTKPPSVSSGHQSEQEHEDEDEDECDVVPGAVRAPGVNSTGVQDDDLTVADVHSTGHFDAVTSTTDETELVMKPQAAVETEAAEAVRDNGHETFWALLCAGVVVVLSAIIVGSACAGTRDTSPATTALTMLLRPSPAPTGSLTPTSAPTVAPFPPTSTPTSTPRITPKLFTSSFGLFVCFEVSSQALEDPMSPQHAALDWMTNKDTSTDLQSTMSQNELVERFVLVLL